MMSNKANGITIATINIVIEQHEQTYVLIFHFLSILFY